jgi:hypothetical protein
MGEKKPMEAAITSTSNMMKMAYATIDDIVTTQAQTDDDIVIRSKVESCRR